ncbi:ABC transporter permease [Mesorhizobium sp. PL10]
MWYLIPKRMASALATLALVSVVIFFSTLLLPGDTAQALLGQNATPETLAALRTQLGLDQPALSRYLHWVGGIAKGDLGTSISNGRAVSTLIGSPFANSLKLAAIAALISIPVGLALGVWSVLRVNSIVDRSINMGAVCIAALPEFFLCVLLTYIFAVQLGLLPATAMLRPRMSWLQQFRTLALPVAVLSLAVIPHLLRMTRAAMLEVLTRPYIETALLKGAPRHKVVLQHALPNAIAPIVTVVASVVAYLIAGVVVVEVAFAYPGLGRLMVESVAIRDLPLIQACGLVFCAVYLIVNCVADILALLANPRLRRRNGGRS